MTSTVIHVGDAVEWARNSQEKFHALLCDPPYHLVSIVKRFGKENSAPAKHGKDGAFARASRGFMGKTWDGGDVAFRPETWKAFKKALYPGAFGMAFASSRGWARMVVAIEEAGFITHPSVFMLGWNTAQGFPKATSVELQLQKRRGVVTVEHGRCISNGAMVNLDYQTRKYWHDFEIALAGHFYGGQAMKPAVEPILVFQKPYGSQPLMDIVETGAGTLNIDDARIVGPAWKWGTQTDIRGGRYNTARPSGGDVLRRNIESRTDGRWPANMVLVHHPGCKVVGVGTVHAAGGSVTGDVVGTAKPNNIYGKYRENHQWIAYGNGDGTETVERWECHEDCAIAGFDGDARFYYQAGWAEETLEGLWTADPIKYVPKATREEREAGLDEEPETVVTDGRTKPIDNPYLRGETKRKQIHPTVKPLALTRWLSSLLLPPAKFAERRLFVPFAGVASEMIGAVQAGWDNVVGVELGEDYAELGQKRLDYWSKTEIPAPPDAHDVQMTLF